MAKFKSSKRPNDKDPKVKRDKKGRPMRKSRLGRDDMEAMDKSLDERRHGNNDLSWHVKDPQILRDIASLPFSNVLSSGITVQVGSNAQGYPIYGKYDTPGIMVFHYQPSYGANFTHVPGTGNIDYGSRWQTNPLNMGMRAMRAFLRSNNSGSTNALDDTDYMQYIIAMDSAYMLWSWAVRLYGFLNTYSYKNRYAPEGIIGAMGISNETKQRMLYDNMAQLRYTINSFALRMSSLAVPSIFPIINRHMWMTSHVFTDSQDPKAQLYVFTPSTYYIYDEAHGKLVAHDFLTELNSGTDIVKTIRIILNGVLDPLLASQSVGIMSGDILKAYGSNIYSFASIPSEFSLVPEYDASILPMIHNTKAYGVKLGDIEQTSNTLYTKIADTGSISQLTQNEQIILNVPYSDPSPEDVLYATRFISGWKALGTHETETIYEYICGTENIVSLGITSNPADGNVDDDNIYTLYQLPASASASVRATFYQEGLWRTTAFQQFDWAPYLLFNDLSVTAGYLNDALFAGDMCNYTTIGIDTLQNIHDGDFCGMYNIPYTMTTR